MSNPGPEPVSLMVQGAWVLTMNPQHEVFSPGAVALKDADIVAVGPPAELVDATLSELEESGQLDLVAGDQEILPGVKLVKTGGHTAGHQGVEFSSGGETIVYYADIIPSSHHFKVPYVASADLFPMETMKVKRSLVKRALAGEIAIAFDHDIEIPIGTVHAEGIKTVIRPVD